MVKCGIRFLYQNDNKIIKDWEYFIIDVDLNDDNYYLVDDAITEKIRNTDFSKFFNSAFVVEIDIFDNIEKRYFNLTSKGLKETNSNIADEIYEDDDGELENYDDMS